MDTNSLRLSMRLLIITRLYSGLYDSVCNHKWRPKGQIAFCKLLENLQQKNVEFDVVLTEKEMHDRKFNVHTIKFEEFDSNFRIIPHSSVIKLCKIIKHGILFYYIQDLIQLIYILKVYYEKKYDLLYIDRVNVSLAAFFSLFLRKRVVLRLNGVATLWDKFNSVRTKFLNPLNYFSYFAPFSHIIVNEDGSPVRQFLERFRRRDVSYQVYLNGCDKIEESAFKKSVKAQYNWPPGVPVILYVSRLVADKGGELFVDSLIKLNHYEKKFCALIVGDGPLYEKLVRKVADNQLQERIIFTGSIENSLIYQMHKESDIYVSLNFLGNLANSVIEAIHAGSCIVTLKKDDKSFKDFATMEILKDSAVFIDRNKVIDELPRVLSDLIKEPDKIERLKTKMQKVAQEKIRPWSARMEEEIELLRRISSNSNRIS